MDSLKDPRISVCIPFAGKSLVGMESAAAAASRSLAGNGVVTVVADGAEASALLREAALDPSIKRMYFDVQAGLVGNWNRCLRLAEFEIVHIHHDDDTVGQAFYPTVMELIDQFPAASVYAIGRGPESATEPDADSGAALYEGAAAAELLMTSGRTCCGSILLRIDGTRTPYFDERYPYCPDEELYPRWASPGGVAFNPKRLYFERSHPDQARYGTWVREDFTEVYFAARRAGAEALGREAGRLVAPITARGLISAAMTMSIEGRTEIAARMLKRASREYPAMLIWPAYWMTLASCHSGFLRRRAVARRQRQQSF